MAAYAPARVALGTVNRAGTCGGDRLSSEIAGTVVSFGLNLLGAVLVIAFERYLSSQPTSEVGAAGVSVIVLGLAGSALAAVSVLLRDTLADLKLPFGTAGSELVLILVCLGLALTRSRTSVFGYLVCTLALWAPFIAVWLWLNKVESFAENFLPVAAGLFAACAGLGALVVMFRKRSSA